MYCESEGGNIRNMIAVVVYVSNLFLLEIYLTIYNCLEFIDFYMSIKTPKVTHGTKYTCASRSCNLIYRARGLHDGERLPI